MNSVPTASPLSLAIIQLGSLGETIQTLMALRAAKQLYPQLDITLIVQGRLAMVANKVPWIKQVVPFATEDLIGPYLNDSQTKRETLSALAKWIRPLCQSRWDIVVNWTYSVSSSYMAGILPARVKLGFTCRKDGSLHAPDGWSHFILAIVQQEGDQNIHLTDILTTQLLTALQIHVGDPKDPGQAAVTSKAFFNLELGDREFMRDPSKKWVAFQVPTQQNSSFWTLDETRAFLELLLSQHSDTHVVLISTPQEIGRPNESKPTWDVESLRTFAPDRITNLAGKANFDLWANIVSKSSWLISSDSPAIHLASVLGVRVLNLCFGNSRWIESGPYGNGHYVVAPLHAGSMPLSPQGVYAVWAYGSSEWAHRRQIPMDAYADQIQLGPDLSTLRVYRSKIRETSEGGGIVYEPLHRHPIQTREWFCHVLGYIARAWYCGWVPEVGLELPRQVITPELIRDLRQLQESAQVMKQICQKAKFSALQLRDKTSRLKSQNIMTMSDREHIDGLNRQINELEHLLERAALTTPHLKSFTTLLRVLMHNLKGEHVHQLAQQTGEAYQQIHEGLEFLDKWIQHTQTKSRPVMIVSTHSIGHSARQSTSQSTAQATGTPTVVPLRPPVNPGGPS